MAPVTTMSNMSYCRFQNTLSDLEDCYGALTDKLSQEEHNARKRLVALCADIVQAYGEALDNDEVSAQYEEDENEAADECPNCASGADIGIEDFSKCVICKGEGRV